MKIKAILPVFAVIAALAIGIAASAFQSKSDNSNSDVKKSNKTESVTAIRWYFTGNSGEENNPAKYQKDPVDDRDCGGLGSLCSIMDEPGANPNQPGLTHGTVSVSNTAYSPDRLVIE